MKSFITTFTRLIVAAICVFLLLPAPLPVSAAPPKVSRPYPYNGQQNVSTNTVLTWDDVGAASYDVYFGTSSNPPYRGNVRGPIYDVGKLSPNTTYFWRVNSKDLWGGTTTGDVYSFRTGSAPAHGNRPAQNGTQVFLSSFDNLNGWSTLYLAGSSGGSASVSNGKLNLSVDGGNKIFGVYNTTALSGNFYVEAEFTNDQQIGIALVRKTNNAPDPNNYIMLGVNNNGGVVYVNAYDKQNGQAQVLGSTFRTLDDPVDSSRYQIKLDGTVYSMPFVGTNKRIRLMREGVSGTFHLYVLVRKQIHGVWKEGWIETAPIYDWGSNPNSNEFYMALVVRSGSSSATAQFDNARAMIKPMEDRDDSNTGFRITRGEYNWSGFFGDAIVVTFGDKFPYANRDYKFVFWDQAQYIPAWHINNQVQYSYEFHETWDPNDPEWLLFECFEPMSDRLLSHSQVSIVEDNAVRKVVKWEYWLINPNYIYLDEGEPGTGPQAPEVLEYWIFYPDGTIIRQQRYTPKLDGNSFDPNYETGEAITVSGSKILPRDVIPDDEIHLFDLGNNFNNGGQSESVYKGWNQVIWQNNYPTLSNVAPFLAYSHDSATPDTYPGFKMDFRAAGWTGLDWSHFPVDMQPYQNKMGSFDSIRAFVNHTQNGNHGSFSDQNWNSYYQTDGRGRRYREYVSIAGMSTVGNKTNAQNAVRTWLFPGTVNMLDNNSAFVTNDRARKTLVFNRTGNNQTSFNLTPTGTIVNPVFQIQNWSGGTTINVRFNNTALTAGVDYFVAQEGSSLLVWVNRTFNSTSKFEIWSGTQSPTATPAPATSTNTPLPATATATATATNTPLPATATATATPATPTPTATLSPTGIPTPTPTSSGVVRLTGTPFGTNPPYAPGYEFDKAFDANTSTFFDFSDDDNCYTGLDLGVAREIKEIRFFPRDGYAWRMNGGKFQGSNTSTSGGFVDLFTIGDAQPGWNIATLTISTPYRYVRYVGGWWSHCNVAEIELYGR